MQYGGYGDQYYSSHGPAYEWEEEYDEESKSLYYYSNYTYETVWEMPYNFDGPTHEAKVLVETMSEENIKQLVKIQKAYKAHLAQKRIDFMMIEDYNRSSEHCLQKNNLRDAIEELHDCHDLLKKYKNDDLEFWHDVCKRLRDMRMTYQSDCFFKACELKKNNKIENGFFQFQECFRTLSDMNTKTFENGRMAGILISTLKLSAKVAVIRTQSLSNDITEMKARPQSPDEDDSSDSDKGNQDSSDVDGPERGRNNTAKETTKTFPDFMANFSTLVLDVVTEYAMCAVNHCSQKEQAIEESKAETHPVIETENDRKIRSLGEMLWQLKAGCYVQMAMWYLTEDQTDNALLSYEAALKDTRLHLKDPKLEDSLLELLFDLEYSTCAKLAAKHAANPMLKASYDSRCVSNGKWGGAGADFKANLGRFLQHLVTLLNRINKSSPAIKAKFQKPFYLLHAEALSTCATLEKNMGYHKDAIVRFVSAIKILHTHVRHEKRIRFSYNKLLYDEVVHFAIIEVNKAQTWFMEGCYEKAAAVYESVYTFATPYCETLENETVRLRRENKSLVLYLTRRRSELLNARAQFDAASIPEKEGGIPSPEATALEKKLEQLSKDISDTEIAVSLGNEWETYARGEMKAMWDLVGRAIANHASCFERQSLFDVAIILFEKSLTILQKYSKECREMIKVLLSHFMQTHLNRVAQAFEYSTMLFQDNRILGCIREFEKCQKYAVLAKARAAEMQLLKPEQSFHFFHFRCIGNRAIAHERLGEHKKAMALLKETLAVIGAKPYPYERHEMITLRRIGNLYLKETDHRMCLKTLAEIERRSTKHIQFGVAKGIPKSGITWLGHVRRRSVRRIAVIQCVFRYLNQGSMLWAATKLQCVWRGRCDRLRVKQIIFQRRTNASTKIQSWIRSYLSRKTFYFKKSVSNYKYVIRPLKLKSANKLGRWWKLNRFRRLDIGLIAHQAATDVQRVFRGHRIRSQLSTALKYQDTRVGLSLHNDSATSIQTAFRAYIARKKLTDHQVYTVFQNDVWLEIKTEAATVIQRPTRAWIGRQKLRRARRHYLENLKRAAKDGYATTIQKRWRGILGRKRAHYFRCIRKVQAWLRMCHVRLHRSIFWKHMDVSVSLHRPEVQLTHEQIFHHLRDAPEYILKSVGFKCREKIRSLPNRPPFFLRKGALKYQNMKAVLNDKPPEHLCKHCNQQQRWPGDKCCCHMTPPCRSCVANRQRLRLHGRPASLGCDRKKTDIKKALPP